MRTCLAAALSLALMGCASSGPAIDTTRLSELRQGQTTVAEVVSRFGRPTVISRNMDGTQTAAYMHTDGRSGAASLIPLIGAFAGSTHANVDSVIFYFDAKGILTGYQTTRADAGKQTAKAESPQGTPDAADKTTRVNDSKATQANVNKLDETNTGARTKLNLPTLLPSATKDPRATD